MIDPPRPRVNRTGSGPIVAGPPKVHKIMAQNPKKESMGSIGSILLAILEAQVDVNLC